MPPPEGVRQMSLADVLTASVRQEPSLLRATIDTRIAGAAVLEAAGLDDWALSAVLSGSRSQSSFGTDQSESDSVLFSADLSRSIFTGGTFILHTDGNYQRQDGFDGLGGFGGGTTYSSNVEARFVQPLLRGRGEAIARSAQTRAALGLSAAELDRRVAATAAVQQVIGAYWELAFSWRDLEIRRASMDLAQAQLRNTRARIRAGAVAPTEALAVEQIIATREEEILNAQLAVTDRSLALRARAGMDLGPGDIDVWASAPLAVAARQFDIAALVALTYEQSPQLASLSVRRDQLALDIRVAEDGGKPAVDLDVAVGSSGFDDNAADTLSTMARLEDLTFSAALRLDHTFGQRQVRGRAMSAREQLERLKVDIGEIRADLARNVVLSVRQAEAAEKRIAIARRVISLAEQNIEAEQARFELGRSTNFDVLERQDELKQAQLREARAIIDYLQAVTALDAATGELLGRYGVRLEE